ncbi:MAG: carbamoyl-phosphate synthase small subunit, partial [bacterium]
MRGILLLEDGRSFEGSGFGAVGTRVGELVFNTSMTGYQEVLTDPSYTEQVVVMTAAHVGNYGVNSDDPESDNVQVSGFVARRFTNTPSSWRSEQGLGDYLSDHAVPGVHRIDTRALVRHLRSSGAMRCAISTEDLSTDALMAKIRAWPGMVGRDLATEVSRTDSIVFAAGKPGA